MKLNLLFKSVIITACLATISSCDKDFNQIGTDVLGDNDHYGLLTDSITTTIAYNVETKPVQTNNLPVNTLGFYDNAVFGKTTSNFITQLSLATASPVFINPTNNIVVDSVYLHVPYFYTPVSIDETSGDTTFKEDSLIGSGKIKIDVYRSNFFLETLDSSPGSGLTENKKYFSDEDFSTSLASARLNNSLLLSENDNFEFKKTQIKFYKNDAAGAPATTTVRERLNPGLFMMLDKTYFKDYIINADPIKLSNNLIFREYFRGLYFKVSPSSSDPSSKGALNRLNFAQGKITIIYKDKTSATDATVIRKTLVLNLSGNTVNTFTNNFNPNYANKLVQSYNSTTVGAQRLYLKGGEGSMAVISLFGGRANDATSANEIEKFRTDKCLISDASLTFTIDKTASGMNSEIEPRRIYLYDYDNKAPLLDYFTDFTSGTNPKFNKFIHGGIIKLNSNSRGTTYKIKLTNHIQNLVRDKTKKNVRLGLVVTENINITANYGLKPSLDPTFVSLPVMAHTNPLGTVLYGTALPSTDPKKLKLVIRYTKPE